MKKINLLESVSIFQKPILVEKKYLIPFIAINSMFFLWGVANDVTNPMVSAGDNKVSQNLFHIMKELHKK